MTSPPATPIAAAVVDMAPTSSSNNEALPTPDLTAAEASTPHATETPAPSLPQETDNQGDQGRQDVLHNGAEVNKDEIVENEHSHSNPEASIPQDPNQNEPLGHESRPITAQELVQVEALSALLAYAHPSMPAYNEMGPGGISQLSMDDAPMSQAMDPQQPYPGTAPYLREADQTRISAYAMLEFPDGQFYMNTYSVILGRDLAAARAALRRDAEEARQIEEHTTPGEPQTPVRSRRDESRYTRSVISESGGILREGDDSGSDERTRRRRIRRASRKSKSTGSSSRRNSLAQPNGKMEYQAQPQLRRHAPDSAGAVPVDPASLRPSPHDCPLVGIHPPAATAASGYKAISRQHVKIAYNSKKSLFEAEIIGRNGAFVDEKFYYHAETVELKSGSRLQIGGVVVRFVLPDVAIGETGAEHRIDYDDSMVADRYSEGGKEMSFDFEDTPRDGVLAGDSSDDDASEEGDEDGFPGQDVEEDEDMGDDLDGDNEDEEEDGENSEQSDGQGDVEDEEEEEPVEEIPPPPPKRRGPGRPPKNGIMSKREQQLAKKAAQQKAKKTVPQPPSTGKNKVGRPRKHPRPETPPIKTEKRKYTKRKPKDPDAAVKQEGSQDDDRPAKDKKEKKAARPPRSPSPTFNEADLTPEQLAKPQANYVTLIHEALTASPTGQMSLPQIYRAIQRKYPFFVLKCNTNGWQSSVRHNLSQHHAFRKVERDGKGWMWAVVDGVSIEKEKKRRPSPSQQLPPGHMHQQIYRAGPLPQHMVPRPPGMMGPPPGYPMSGTLPQDLRPGQPQQYGPPSVNGYPSPGPHPGVNGEHIQSFGQPPPMTPPVGPQSTSYSSPYAPKLTSGTTPPQGPSNSAPEHNFSAPAQPQQGVQQQVRPNYQPPQLPNENIALAIDTFKTALTTSLKGKSNNAEAVVASAINRVLGITTQSTVPGDPHEEKIMAATRAMLNKLPGYNVHNTQLGLPPQHPAPLQGQLLSHTPPAPGTGNLAPAQPPISQGSDTTKPTPPSIARPSFSGQSITRPNGASSGVPRPPMMTPVMASTKSSSPANTPGRSGGTATSSASPAPMPPSTPANNNSAAISNGTTPNNGMQKPSPSASAINDNGKRHLDNAEDLSGRDFKRLNTAGPPPLKT